VPNVHPRWRCVCVDVCTNYYLSPSVHTSLIYTRPTVHDVYRETCP